MAKHLEEKFDIYDKENSHIYLLFVKFTMEAKDSGRCNYSSKAIFERIRWFVDVETSGDTFKINNNYPAYYARKMMQDYPEFSGFFRTRELQ